MVQHKIIASCTIFSNANLEASIKNNDKNHVVNRELNEEQQ